VFSESDNKAVGLFVCVEADRGVTKEYFVKNDGRNDPFNYLAQQLIAVPDWKTVIGLIFDEFVERLVGLEVSGEEAEVKSVFLLLSAMHL